MGRLPPNTLALLLLVGAIQPTACQQNRGEHLSGASDLIVAWPESLGKAQRKPAFFPHRKHVEELRREGCRVCHPLSDGEKLLPFELATKIDCSRRESCLQGYHDFCSGCHLQRHGQKLEAGPTDCGGCHRPATPPPAVVKMFFDYSLHQRHVITMQEKGRNPQPRPCDRCHHTGEANACFECHLQKDQEGVPSWRKVAHLDCLNCHLDRSRENLSTGPFDCAACHQAEARAKIARLTEVPRLLGGQPDTLWVEAKGTKAPLVPFNHRNHEVTTFFCTACHHRALGSCGQCHDAEGRLAQSGGVSLEQAYHRFDSDRSCVGCHVRKAAQNKACRACHQWIASPGKEGCVDCHRGPSPEKMIQASENQPLDHAQADAPRLVPRAEFFNRIGVLTQPADLQKEDFPDQIELDSGGKDYRPTSFPHGWVVEQLYKSVVKNKLAFSFMPRLEVFCSGCHHHQPAGQRPAGCGSCHHAEGSLITDHPGLVEAYHRQCLGCHQAMDLVQSCEGCHQKQTGKESEP